MLPLPDQNVRSVLMPAVRLLGKTRYERKKSNQPHTHDRSRQKKKSHDASFPKQSSEDERPPTCSHHFTTVLPPSCCPLLSPPQHHPENRPPSAPHPPRNPEEPPDPTHVSTQTRKIKQAMKKRKRAWYPYIRSGKRQQKIAREEKDQRGIDVRKTTRDGYIYSNNRSNKQQHQHQVEEVVTKRTTQNSHLHLPSLFPVLSPFSRSIRPRLPAYTEKEIFSLQK